MLKPRALRRFCTEMKRLYCTMGRTERIVPPRPAISAPKVNCCPWCGEIGLSMVLNEKFGKILLVMIPSSALGPEIPRKARHSTRFFDAVLRASSDERSNEYVIPTRLKEWRRG